MSLAKEVLEREAAEVVQAGVHISPLGFARVDVDALAAVPLETACRVIGQIASRIGGRGFRAHLQFEEQLVELALARADTGGRTSGGCIFRPAGNSFLVLREPARCAPNEPLEDSNRVWDHRFNYEVQGDTEGTDLHVGLLDEVGLAQIPKDYSGFSEVWRDAPREARLTTPGLWKGNVLLSAPLAPWTSAFSAPKLLVSTVWSK